jgi:hypothetical protein
VETIHNFPSPKNYADLHHFIGMINFNRAFILNFANFVALLQELVGSTNQRNYELFWNVTQINAFEEIKQHLSNASTLNYIFNQSQIYHIVTDASNIAL